MKKTILTFSSATLAGALLAARPQVSDVTFAQAADGTVTITYALADGPAIVTLDVCTNCTATSAGASIGDRFLRHLSGDVNARVDKETGTIVWKPGADAPGFTVDTATVKPVVKAWSEDDPPDVMVVDLLKRGAATTYDLHYYPSLEALPEAFPDGQLYKGAALVMKRVRAPRSGKYRFGNFGEPGLWGRAEEKPAEFTLTEDYYLGVFQLTKLQNAYIRNGLQVGVFKAQRELRPLEDVAFITLRGTAYPNEPSGTSVLKLLRDRTGYAFDFPNENQWEYACRAGNVEGFWPNGTAIQLAESTDLIMKDYVSNTTEPTLDRLARYWMNASPYNANTLAADGATAIVGSYEPNAWGFYDMLGNVYEFCLDFYKADRSLDTGSTVESAEAGSENVVVRGGCYWDQWYNCRSSRRTSVGPSTANNGVYGCRLCCPIVKMNK